MIGKMHDVTQSSSRNYVYVLMYSYIEAAEADNTASFSRPICIK